ncbi:HTH-type transcriptional repressor RghR [compost metagenome]
MGNQFGEYIRLTRSMRGYTLRELAEKSDISFSQLSKIERGESAPSPATVEKIAYAFNENKYELLTIAGYLDAEVLEDISQPNVRPSVLVPIRRSKEQNASKQFFEAKRVSLAEALFEWAIINEDDLDPGQLADLLQELETYYEVRKKFMLSRKNES